MHVGLGNGLFGFNLESEPGSSHALCSVLSCKDHTRLSGPEM